MEERVTNAEFAEENQKFIEACEEARKKGKRFKKLMPTVRQASKYRNQKGMAWKTENKIEVK